MSTTRFPYSFANYPLSFRGCVVSPTKICLQFNSPQIKLRLHGQGQELPKIGPVSDRYVPVTTKGIEVDCTSIGCQMPVVEDYQMQLLEAYELYYRTYNNTYRETYKKDFKDFISKLKTQVDQLFKIVSCEGDK